MFTLKVPRERKKINVFIPYHKCYMHDIPWITWKILTLKYEFLVLRKNESIEMWTRNGWRSQTEIHNIIFEYLISVCFHRQLISSAFDSLILHILWLCNRYYSRWYLIYVPSIFIYITYTCMDKCKWEYIVVSLLSNR